MGDLVEVGEALLEIERALVTGLRAAGQPEDVARAALFLASDDAGWISGIILDVAGGSVLA